ncbi:hypothetical protein [Streptomyces sp. NPDC046685]|uniref:hypothetical protein n=1 Tax=Streptomyces sp. NPDC046685 TaxID=3157202 RepID=UPI0033F612B0
MAGALCEPLLEIRPYEAHLSGYEVCRLAGHVGAGPFPAQRAGQMAAYPPRQQLGPADLLAEAVAEPGVLDERAAALGQRQFHPEKVGRRFAQRGAARVPAAR